MSSPFPLSYDLRDLEEWAISHRPEPDTRIRTEVGDLQAHTTNVFRM
jgi:hypothetical protein